MLPSGTKLREGSCYHHLLLGEYDPFKGRHLELPNEFEWTLWAEPDVFDARERAVFVIYDTTTPNKIVAESDILGLPAMMTVQNSNRRVTEAWQSFKKVYDAADKVSSEQ